MKSSGNFNVITVFHRDCRSYVDLIFVIERDVKFDLSALPIAQHQIIGAENKATGRLFLRLQG